MVKGENAMIKPIRFDCVPVLPTVYGDALSYYEEVCKMTEKMNEIIEDINTNLSKYFDENFNKFMMDAVYDEANERIVLSKKVIVSSDVHSYDADTNTIKVG